MNIENIKFENDFILRLREAVKKYREKNQKKDE
jgi:hypothetical protein